ncbi:MAG: redoxin domain-containing protein [Planctomycetota bacterium]
MRVFLAFVCLLSFSWNSNSFSAESETTPETPAAGHSYHGEAFNEGPRQSAVLIDGMSEIDFPTSTKSESAQAFFEQGIAALHGFWYLEAERSFRQAALEDSEMAIAYWGMAMANVNNLERARGFIDRAKEASKKNTSKRERLYIDALARYLPAADSFKDDDEDQPEKTKEEKEKEKDAARRRGERYLTDLEKILHEHPDDIEAKAFLVVQMWMGERQGVKLTSRYAVNALLSEIFEANPNHPAHHYRIHLWDRARPENAIESAALCGPSSPGIAHMWHMPGHIYSKLKRYGDAAWQQEASARVDHAHMIRTRLMPDQIHNFAHNNEWLIRNLVHLGRLEDAIDLARNMISLPKHPSFNTLEKRGSHRYGRMRLLQVFTEFGLWQELIDEMNGPYLAEVEHSATRLDEQAWLVVAKFQTGKKAEGEKLLRDLKRKKLKNQLKLLDLEEIEDSEEESKKINEEVTQLTRLIARGTAAQASVNQDKDTIKEALKTAALSDSIAARWLEKAGDLKGAVEKAKQAVNSGNEEVIPLAVYVDLLWKSGDEDEAKKRFKALQSIAGEADLETPLLTALKPIAEAVDAKEDWRVPSDAAKDLGQRPPLDDLGPFRWQPYPAQSWTARSADDELINSEELERSPRLVIFYLGFGCLHCVEQLHEFGPRADEFREAGIDVLAISTESTEDLMTGMKAFKEDVGIPLYANSEQKAFKDFRCWDDFESQPLHGTFLIDANGFVRWQDISYEPFMDVDFLLKESKRLLELP